jgi:SAM-dependent methyltransferase
VNVVAGSPARSCPVCDTPAAQARLFLRERLDAQRLNAYSFASRKEPEFMNHRYVECPRCELVYVDAPPSQAELAQAYHEAAYDSAEEADDAAQAYVRALAPVLARLPRRESALEIGTGTAVFLEHLQQAGFTRLLGVEPSAAAIAAAPPARQAWIQHGIFDATRHAPESFDLICCFMTLEHVQDPGELVRQARPLLRAGGALVTVTHDWRAAINRWLGARSPIIDIEHMQLFSGKSATTLFERSGFVDVSVTGFANRYALGYWARLLPLPAPLKRPLQAALRHTGLARKRWSANVGNFLTVGFKPE